MNLKVIDTEFSVCKVEDYSQVDLNEEFGLNADDFAICKTIDMFATELDGSGAGINWFDGVTVEGGDADSTEFIHVTAEAPAEF